MHSKIQGVFKNQRIVELAEHKPNIEWGTGFIAMAINDIRGVTTRPVLDWRGRPIEFQSGSGIKGVESGMHAEILPLELTAERSYEFSYAFELRGMESLSFSPVGKTNRITLRSDWLHPSFIGLLLPQKRTVSESGFEALWQTSSFSTNMRQQVEKCEQGDCTNMLNNRFGVALVQPIDIYHLAERSVKYGILFVGLTFLSFLMFEALKQQAVHPVQYIFVGSALTIFFLLLVSLSEHFTFGLSYAVATVACTGLLTVYLSAIFRQLRYGLIFGATIGVVYALLFVIIRAENAALLMGTLLIFAALCVLMVATRNVDWYKYDLKKPEKSVPDSGPVATNLNG